jgi:ribosomal protein S18 acetylase RimI-like enzyme
MNTTPPFVVTPIDEALRRRVQPLVNDAWAGPLIAVNGQLWNTEILPGLAALDANGSVLGYLLYAFHDGLCEIMALESLRENCGVGARLIGDVKEIARERQLKKVVVTTTNDNLHAIRFYQKRGFTLKAFRPKMLETSRILKPSIPLIGLDGIPLRDEIELEIDL